MLANDASENEARNEEAPKTTLPSSGERGGWAPPEAEATTAFTQCTYAPSPRLWANNQAHIGESTL